MYSTECEPGQTGYRTPEISEWTEDDLAMPLAELAQYHRAMVVRIESAKGRPRHVVVNAYCSDKLYEYADDIWESWPEAIREAIGSHRELQDREKAHLSRVEKLYREQIGELD